MFIFCKNDTLKTVQYLLVLFDLETVGLADVLLVLPLSWFMLDPCPGFLLPPGTAGLGLETGFLMVEDGVPLPLSGVVLDTVAVLVVDDLAIIHCINQF